LNDSLTFDHRTVVHKQQRYTVSDTVPGATVTFVFVVRILQVG